ncbi:MAG: helix-hairpin-helix domain-containing protein [Proteobacteria bacterium]|nr:helix-hairpin-helix domain-containing protein [Pseudomonadota bacterium]
MLASSPTFSADSRDAKAQETKADAGAKAAKSAASPAKPNAPRKLVDLNSATKAELMKVPGIRSDEADKIIAQRPFKTKAHLVTHDIISLGQYGLIKDQVIARQATEGKTKAKPAK